MRRPSPLSSWCSGLGATPPNATVEGGRLLVEPVEPRDRGRCCQDRVFDRDGAIAVLGDGESLLWLNLCDSRNGCCVGLGLRCDILTSGLPYSFRGISSISRLCADEEGGRDGVLDRSLMKDRSMFEGAEPGVPEYADESFVGERDRARSVWGLVSELLHHHEAMKA